MSTSRAAVRLVMIRDEGQCVIAGPHCLGSAQTAHHRANRGMGGSKLMDDPRNLLGACYLCNGEIEDAHGQQLAGLIEHGHRVLKAATSAKTIAAAGNKPVRYPDGSWWFLLANGERVEITDPTF